MSAVESRPAQCAPTSVDPERRRRAFQRWSKATASCTNLLHEECSSSIDIAHVASVLYQLVHGIRELKKQGCKGIILDRRHRSESFNDGHNGVRYDTLQESKQYITEFKANRLYQKGEAYTTGGKLHMFVIGTDATSVFVRAPQYKFKPDELKYHHSSFLSGAPIVAAGEMRTNAKSELTELTDRSGHYRPKLVNFLEGLSILVREHHVELKSVKIKVHFSKKIKVGIAHGGHLYFDDGHEFLLTKGRAIPVMVSSLQQFNSFDGKGKITEQGYIKGIRDYRGVIIKLMHIFPEEEVVSIHNPNYHLGELQKEKIILSACINSLRVFERRGLNLSGVTYTHQWDSGIAEYDAKEFLDSWEGYKLTSGGDTVPHAASSSSSSTAAPTYLQGSERYPYID